MVRALGYSRTGGTDVQQFHDPVTGTKVAAEVSS
jgi:hypothetical protein